MKRYKATVEWREDKDAKGIKRYEYLEFTAASFAQALELTENHMRALPNSRLTRIETI